MSKKLISSIMSLIMCFSLTMYISAYDGEEIDVIIHDVVESNDVNSNEESGVTVFDDLEIIDVGCCSDHDATYINHDISYINQEFEQINFDVAIMSSSICTHRWQRVVDVDHTRFIATHVVGDFVCTITLYTKSREIWCNDTCKIRLNFTILSAKEQHTICKI